MSMDNVLVTGGAGFIGSHLCEYLLRQKKRIAILDNLDDYYDPRLKRTNLQEVSTSGKFEFFQVDIRNSEKLRNAFERFRPDSVVHLAARAGVRPSLQHPDLYISTNIVGTGNLLELSQQFGVQRFVFASSSSIYGLTDRIPFSEEGCTPKPLSVYGATKSAGETLATTYAHLYPLSVICLRLFTVYGPRQRPDLAIRKFAELILEGKELPLFGDGSMRRDYTCVSDIVLGIAGALEAAFHCETFNLGSSRPIRLDEVVETLERVLAKKAAIKYLPAPPGEMPITYADLTKSRKLLGYEPRVKFEDGAQAFARWLTKRT
jgi:UDP-glucuronate 4-epimerase